MGFSSATCRTIPVALRLTSTDLAPTLHLPVRNSAPLHSFSNLNIRMCKKQEKSVKTLQSFVAAAVVPDRNTRFGDSCEEGPSSRDSSNADVGREYDEHSDAVERNGSEGDQCSDANRMTRICDKLIDVFLVDMPSASDWRKSLAFSKEWSKIRPHFFRRCQERAVSENDPGNKQRLFRLGRKIKEVDDDIQRHNDLLEVVRGLPSKITEVVSRRRKDFTKEFFEHLHIVAASHHDSPTERDALAELGNACLSAVQAYDGAPESKEEYNSAELKLPDIISSSSLDASFKKIDDLAVKNQLDSALGMQVTKAWAAGKETNLAKDEVHDMMFDMYDKAVDYNDTTKVTVPKEVRIVQYLLEIEDPLQQVSLLRDAFTPGEEFEGDTVDMVYTTPKKLHTLMVSVLNAYQLGRKRNMHAEGEDLVRPENVRKLENLKRLVEMYFT